jgi:alpha-mannosidase
MITVHLIGNAHLDPVWLWRWPAGVGEAIATCRSAVQLLDKYPEFIFTRSDMWLHEQIGNLDPDLFERIREYAKAERWQIVGGWYVQPDCNLPTAESFRKHISISKAYFMEKFSVDVTVGYNVDSFGHNAMIPSFLKEAGYDSYVMMRPMAHEKPLPSSLFRWRSPDGAEVIVWRIPRAYTAWQEDLTDHIQASLDVAPPGMDHVMCFYGVGDHGGGPTRQQIEWLIKHRDAFPGAQLIFSHPRAFFDAVKPFAEQLPVVEDELQYHAIGCYTVVHELKRHVRRAEHGLISAEIAAKTFPEESPKDAPERLTEAWKRTLFNQFHDIYAGTSLASAYEDARDQLGSARDTADTIINHILFRRMRHLSGDRWQRIVAFNVSDHQFRGYLQHEPWLRWGSFEGWIADEKGNRVPHQRIQHESVAGGDKRQLIWPAEIAPGAGRVFQLRMDEAPPLPESDLKVNGSSISNRFWRISPGEDDCLLSIQRASDATQLMDERGLRLLVQQDSSDTWSHGIDGFREPVIGGFEVEKVLVEETGPVRVAIRIEAAFQRSQLVLWARLYAHNPGLELHFGLDWHQRLQVAKLVMPLTSAIKKRTDGIPGGLISRPQNGQEFPIVDWTLVNRENDSTLGIVCPDCSGIDGRDDSLRFTLLRSPVYAWHDPAKLEDDAFYRWTDQGEHLFRFLILEDAGPEALKMLALSNHRPPVCFDWTKVMA